jgi:uncharacterized protein YjbI with pentapeptide repeats
MGIEQGITFFAEENRDNQASNLGGSSFPTRRRRMSVESGRDSEINNLIALLSRSTQALSQEEYFDSMVKRQEAVDKFLVRGGSESVRRLFQRIKQIEESEGRTIKLDLSMLEISGKLLGDLYLPGANLEKLIFSLTDISGSNIQGSRLVEAVAPRATMRNINAKGTNWTDAIAPGADASGSAFIGSRFINTDMNEWIVDRQTNFAGCVFINVYAAGVDFSIPNTVGAVFRGIRC